MALKHKRDSFSQDYTVQQVSQVHVFTTAIDNSTWTPIILPGNVDCESVLCKCRTATNLWYMSHVVAGSAYITFEAGSAFTLDIDKNSGDTLFYVKGTAASDTFEVVISRG